MVEMNKGYLLRAVQHDSQARSHIYSEKLALISEPDLKLIQRAVTECFGH